MADNHLEGKCFICKKVVGKPYISKHLKTCIKKEDELRTGNNDKLKTVKMYHIVAEGTYASDYWLHLEIPAGEMLSALDAFLREIWLECCWHLSCFTIEGVDYSSYPSERMNDKSMKVKLYTVLSPEMNFDYVYDFGSSTELKLKVLDEYENVLEKHPIRALVRNEAPAIPCSNCGRPSIVICTECKWEDTGWLCENCTEDHECDDDMFLPVVNSPRVGEWGYTGEAG